MSEVGLYWLGFCSADGYVSGNEVQLQLKKADREHLLRFREALRTERPIYDYWNRTYPKSSMYSTSKKLATELKEFGTQTFLKCPINMRRHLIRGIFDGDGSVSRGDYLCKTGKNAGHTTRNRQVRICGTEDVLRAVQRIVTQQAHTSAGCIRQSRGIQEWSLNGVDNFFRFRDWLYQDATIFLPRKRDRFYEEQPMEIRL